MMNIELKGVAIVNEKGALWARRVFASEADADKYLLDFCKGRNVKDYRLLFKPAEASMRIEHIDGKLVAGIMTIEMKE